MNHLEEASEVRMPAHLRIGTKKAFKNGYAFTYEKKKSVQRQFMSAMKAASGLVVMKSWCCDSMGGLGLPGIVLSVPTCRRFCAAKQSFVALQRTLHCLHGIIGKLMLLPILLSPGMRSIGKALSGLRLGCHEVVDTCRKKKCIVHSIAYV